MGRCKIDSAAGHWRGQRRRLRQANQEVWPEDNQTYIIFPSGASGQVLHYGWHPLAHLDGRLTGMRFLIGPHR